jgi:hypothetical protein
VRGALPLRKRLFFAAVAAGCVLCAGGCAPTAIKAEFPYRPSLDLPPGSGTISIVAPEQHERRRDRSGAWIIGDIRMADGKGAGDVVADAPPEEMVLRALAEELKRAGYRVESRNDLNGETGIRIAAIDVMVGEVIHPVTVEAQGEAKLSADVVRKGKVAVRLTYAAKFSKTTVRGSGNPAEEVLGSSVHDLLGQALPGLLKELEKK